MTAEAKDQDVYPEARRCRQTSEAQRFRTRGYKGLPQRLAKHLSELIVSGKKGKNWAAIQR
jgi:hypothetical protein